MEFGAICDQQKLGGDGGESPPNPVSLGLRATFCTQSFAATKIRNKQRIQSTIFLFQNKFRVKLQTEKK